MIEFICLFCPSFVSLMIYAKYFMKKNKHDYFNLICYYFFSVLINNFIMNAVIYFIFKRNDILFTLQFSEKYILLSMILAIHIPIIYNLLSDSINIILKKYFVQIDKLLHLIYSKIKEIKKLKISIKNIKFLQKITKNKIYNVANNIIFIVIILLQFLIFDIVIRYIIYDQIKFYPIHMLTPNILTILYGILVAVILIMLPSIIRRILTIVIYIINLILFVVNYMLILIKSQAFTVYNFQIASEGIEYINFINDKITISFILILLLSIVLFIFSLIHLKKVKCNFKMKKKIIIIIFIILMFFGLRFTSVNILLDDYVNAGGWEDYTYPKFYADNLINSRKSLSVLGLYEYTLRDIIKYHEASSKKYGSIEEIEKIINNSNIENSKNDKTGIFKGKNLIMIMMESIDNVIVDEKTMPTLSMMMNDGWNFTKRYSQLNSGGSTIATEYATLSGLYHSGDKRYDVNDYKQAIPSVFSANNYKVSSFHENNGVYYNRSQLHRSLGFENSYFLYDMDLEVLDYVDAQFFENDKLYDLVVPKDLDTPFMSFITTISAHGPYTNNNHCVSEGITDENTCIRFLSNRTDDMLVSMLKRLEADNLLEDTVIILYSDHAAYAYNYTQEELSDTYEKIDDSYTIKNLPFVIYNSDIDSNEFDDIIVNDVDFAPTIFNLFGIDYKASQYVGTDIFSESHKNICIFTDYSWYDGKKYSVNLKKDDYYIETSKYVKERLDFNKMLISNNYYNRVN